MKKIEGEILINTKTKTLLEIFCEFQIDVEIIIESSSVADDTC